MLPYIAATGHNNYLKSVHLYLQKMSRLPEEHPDVFEYFKEGLHVTRRSDREWAGLSTDLIIEQVLMRSMKTSGGLVRGRGMTEQQRTIWTLAMPKCAEINHTMQELSGVWQATGEQNKDMSPSRLTRDWNDTRTVAQYLKERNPFECEGILCNVATGVHAHTTVNVDIAKVVGTKILDKMEGKTPAEFSFKRSDQVVTLGSKNTVKINGENIQVDPQLLFQRLIVAAQTIDLSTALNYELCTFPPALFQSVGILLEATKSTLAESIWKMVQCQRIDIPKDIQYVLDGGSLLHRIPWHKGTTFLDILKSYRNYVLDKYGEAIIIFDGYEVASTKDLIHSRRNKGKLGPTVSFTAEMTLTSTKELFLSNKMNKQKFVYMLGAELEKINCQVFHDTADADYTIAMKAVESAESIDTVLIGEDTDLLVLLLYHANHQSKEIYFMPEPRKNSKLRVWNIKEAKEKLGTYICKHILFLHAFLGSDTTSRIYGYGKGALMKKIRSNSTLKQSATVFDTVESSVVNIATAGEKVMCILYNGSSEESLNTLRYKRFCEKVATSLAHVQPHNLPPTTAASKFHSLRVFHQICHWKGHNMSPNEWGWEQIESGWSPISTDAPPAPEELLKVIRCNCQTDCSSQRCSCKKHGMKCSLACGNCKGSACQNAGLFEVSDDEDLND